MNVVYFAYGANLDIPAMQARCPGAEPGKTALLEDHRLVAMREGWLSITAETGSRVRGLLWRLAPHHLEALDIYEGVAAGLYVHAERTVTDDEGTNCRVLVYMGTNDGPGTLHAEYAHRVASAAHVVLDAAVAARIRALGPG